MESTQYTRLAVLIRKLVCSYRKYKNLAKPSYHCP